MKKNFKRTLSLILAVLMVITVVPFSGMATDEHEHEYNVPVKMADENGHRFDCACGQKGSVADAEDCTGGIPTCATQAICDVCRAPYGDTLEHNFEAKRETAEYIDDEGDCKTLQTFYFSCANVGCTAKGTDSFTSETDKYGEHVLNTGTVTGATCTANGTLERECTVDECEYTTSATAEDTALGHDFNEKIKDEAHLDELGSCETKTTYYYDCTRCDFNAKDLTTEDKEDYIYEDDFENHNFVAVDPTQVLAAVKSAATCSKKAVYYKNCSVCRASALNIDETAVFEFGEPHAKPTTAAGVIEPGKVDLDKNGVADLKEIDYLRKHAKCDDNEIYSYVCATCYEPMIANNADMSGNDIMIEGIHFYYKDGTAKNPGHADVKKNMTLVAEEKKPTCTEDGNPAKYVCNVVGCKGERFVYAEGEDYKAKGHKYDEKETKTYADATCALDGTYGYKYCTECKTEFYYNAKGEEITAAYVALNPLKKTGHDDSNNDHYCDKCDSSVTAQDTCKCICHNNEGLMYFVVLILKFFWKFTGSKQYCPATCGEAHY